MGKERRGKHRSTDKDDCPVGLAEPAPSPPRSLTIPQPDSLITSTRFNPHIRKMRPERLYGCVFTLLVFFFAPSSATAGDFLCAHAPNAANRSPKIAPKRTQYPTEETGNALILFARFHGEETGGDTPPAWSEEIFDPQQPGSFSHFYDTMSFGKLRMRGEVSSRYYESTQPASAYLADAPAPTTTATCPQRGC